MTEKLLVRGIFFLTSLLPFTPHTVAQPSPSAYAQEVRPRIDSYAGNGVDTATGAFRWLLKTLPFTGPSTREIPLFYDSANTAAGILGPGWSHGYDYRLSPGSPTAGVTITIGMPSGKSIRFRYQSDSTLCTPLDYANRYDELIHTRGRWQLHRPDGTRYNFNDDGDLTFITDANDRMIQLDRPSRNTPISELYAQGGNRLYLGYGVAAGSRRLTSLIDEASRYAQLVYDGSGLLTSMSGPVFMDDVREFPGGSANLSPTLRAVRSLNVTRTTPIGAFRLTGRIQRTQPASGTRPTGPLSVVLEAPNGSRYPLAGATRLGRAGNTETLTWTPDVAVIDLFSGRNPAGNWRVLVRTNSGPLGGFTIDLSLRFGDVPEETRFNYDPNRRLREIIAPDGASLFRNLYDSRGRIIEQDDSNPTNQIATFNYSESNSQTTTVYSDRLGHPWTYVHDANFNLLSYTDPLENTARYTYDANGNRTRIVTPAGNITEFDYDTTGRVTSVWRSGPNAPRIQALTVAYGQSGVRAPIALSDALGNTTRFEANSGNASFNRITDAEGNISQRTYGGAGNLVSVKQGSTNTLEYTYRNGYLSGTRHPHDSGSSIRLNYDPIGRLLDTTEADGDVKTYQYNARLDITQQTDSAGTLLNRYDLRGRLVSTIDRDGNATSYFFDANSNREAVVTEAGRTVYTYDGEDRVLTETDPAGHTRSYEYDAAGRIITVTEADGYVVRTEYDAAGNVVSERDANGRILSHTTYDFRELPVSVMDSLGHETKFTYDDAGRVVEITDPLNRIEKRAYDKIGRLVQVTDPLGRRSTQHWNDQDRITALYDPNSLNSNRPLVEFTYDRANRLTTITTPAGDFRLTYTAADQVSRETTAAGRVRNYTYDTKGNLTNVKTTAPDSTVSPNPDLANEFDASGNLIRVTATRSGQPTEIISRAFDRAKRLIRYTDAAGNILRYTYDDAGNLSRLTYPDGKTVTYGYDKRGRITQVTDWANRITRLTWDPEGGVSRIVFPNGATRDITYDRGGRAIRRIDRTAAGAAIVDYHYTYDAAGQVSAESVVAPAPARVSITPVTMTYGAGNVLATYNGAAVTIDRDGNLTRAGTAYRYDTKNNLVTAGSVAYSYDPEDRLVAWTNSSGATRFVVNPGPRLSQVLTRQEPNGRITRYIYGVGLLYEEVGTGIRVYHYDERGNTTALTNSAGQVDGRVSYSPFGSILSRSGDTNTPFLFSGLFGVLTDPNGLSYMRFRWYSAALRRFLNQDVHFGSISAPGTLNRFAYAGNNPLLRADPEGQFWHVVAGAVIGAVVAVTVQAVSDVIKGKFSGFERYGAVALGGAVGGAITATCGLVLCAAAAGAATSVITSLVESGFRGEAVDFAEVAREAIVGGALGFLGGAGGKVLGKTFSKAPAKWSLKEASKLAPRVLPAAYARKVFRDTVGRELKKQLLIGIGKEAALYVGTEVYNLLSATPPGQDTPRINASAKYAIEGTARQNVNREFVGVFGEFRHWSDFTAALQLAGQPGLNTSVNIFTAF